MSGWEVVLERFWLGVVAHLWQSSLFVGLLFLATRAHRRAPAAVLHLLWLAALAKVLLPLPLLGRLTGTWVPAVGPWAGLGGRSGGEADLLLVRVLLDPVGVLRAPAATGAWPGRVVLAALTAVWAAVAVWILVRWLREIRAARVGSEASGRTWDPVLQASIRAALRGTGIPEDRIVLTDGRRMPCAVGTFRPRILLPTALVRALGADELRAVLLHENAHCRRRDPLVGHLRRLARAVFFFHPALPLVERRLAETAELACDQEVLSFGVPPGVYRRALGRAVSGALAPAAAEANLAGRHSLFRRRLAALDEPRRSIMTRHRIVLAAAALAVAAASFAPVGSGTPVAPGDATTGVLLAGQDGVSLPKIIGESKVAPVYPEEARKGGLTGKVVLQATIDASGAVVEVLALREVEGAPMLTRAAKEAVGQWRYKPATLDGKPVSVYLTVMIDFRLDNDGKDGEAAEPGTPI